MAWHIGNRHVPAEIAEEAIYIGYDHVLIDMLQGLGAETRVVERRSVRCAAPTIITSMADMASARTRPWLRSAHRAETGRALLPLFAWLSPSYPVGSYAYSHTLEWAVEAGDVADEASLASWLADLMTLGRAATTPSCWRHAYRAVAGRRRGLR